jgi:hypothetical protein
MSGMKNKGERLKIPMRKTNCQLLSINSNGNIFISMPPKEGLNA